jgi:probable HAF family extracellular repeat protein
LYIADINAHGQVLVNGERGPEILDGDNVIDLGALIDPAALAFAMNDRGDVVGIIDKEDTSGNEYFEGFIWLSDRGGPRTCDDRWGAGDLSEEHHALDPRGGRLIDLGPGTAASEINNLRQVVGSIGVRAMLWDRGVITDLGTPDGFDSEGVGVNERGQVIGIAVSEATVEEHAFFWDKGSRTEVTAFDGEPNTILFRINDRGEALGVTLGGSNPHHSFIWRSGATTDLGTLGGPTTWARDLNERGQVVGASKLATGESHPFLWERGVMKDLTTISTTHRYGRGHWDESGESNQESLASLEGERDFDVPGLVLRVRNPVRRGAPVIEYRNPTGSMALLEVYDTNGRRVTAREAAGGQALWRSVDMDPLPSGVYFARLSQPGNRVTSRFVIIQ